MIKSGLLGGRRSPVDVLEGKASILSGIGAGWKMWVSTGEATPLAAESLEHVSNSSGHRHLWGCIVQKSV